MGFRRVKVKLRGLTRKSSTIDTPWIDMASYEDIANSHDGDPGMSTTSLPTAVEPTVAAFSPGQQTGTARSRDGASILIHHKTPLLVATPPQITRALAYSHSFILPLNHLAGLLSWTTGDHWESFLLVAAFWFTVLYGDQVMRWIGPMVLVGGLIAGMYSRRYSPLSSTLWSEKQKRKRANSDSRKSVDEILHTLETFTTRCDVLLEPFLRLTEFLSTQLSPTSATTRPALTTLFVRLLALTPIWILLTLPPLRIITTQRVVLVLGTVGLMWHSRPTRVARTILWRSRSIRSVTALVTGLRFAGLPSTVTPLPPRRKIDAAALAATGNSSKDGGIRFTFTVYENQRRWLGIGWTAAMLLHERQAWTDEHNNSCLEPDEFKVPESDSGSTKWLWVPGSEWRVEGSTSAKDRPTKRDDTVGWTYYDAQWHDPKKTDTWGRYTRRRKWVRDAELVESTLEPDSAAEGTIDPTETADQTGIDSATKKKPWFARGQSSRPPRPPPKDPPKDKSDLASVTGSGSTGDTVRSRDGPEDDVHTPHRYRNADWDRSIGEGLAEGLS